MTTTPDRTRTTWPTSWLSVNTVPAAAPPAPKRKPCRLCAARVAADGYRTCQPCSARVLQVLTDLGVLYRQLVVADDALLPTPRGTGGSRAYGSASPTSDALLALTDRRPDVDGVRSDVHSVLTEWVDAVREARGLQLRRVAARCDTANRLARGTVTGELAQLRVHWPWCRRQLRVARLVAALDHVYRRVQDVAGETPGAVRIGHCPTIVDDRPCGSLLLARPGDREVQCRSCATIWPRLRWLELREQVRA